MPNGRSNLVMGLVALVCANARRTIHALTRRDICSTTKTYTVMITLPCNASHRKVENTKRDLQHTTGVFMGPARPKVTVITNSSG